MMKASKKIVSLTISEKLDTVNRYKICDINTLDILVTELDPNSKVLDEYRKRNINLI